jgi:hypothetical protein
MKREFYVRRLWLCLMVLGMSTMAFCQKSGGKKMLFVIAGQSNAVGQGDSLQSTSCKGLPCYDYDVVQNKFVPLRDPVGQKWKLLERANTGSVGPAFAKRMNELTKRDIYIVATARGGASCHKNAWLPPYNTWDRAGGMFQDASAKIDRAVALSGLHVSGILWLQGERDANAILDKKLTVADYKAALKDVIHRFRQKYGRRTPFYIIMTGFQKNRAKDGCMEVRKVQSEVCQEMRHVYVVYDTGWMSGEKGWYKDIVHYNQKSLNLIGKTAAEKVFAVSFSKGGK